MTNMNTENLKKELDAFLGIEATKDNSKKVEKEVVITPKTGLVEKVDRTLIVPDGRTLLTEIYF